MIKIIMLSALYYPYHLGGAEVSNQILCEGLVCLGEYDITVLTHGLIDTTEEIAGVKVNRHYYGEKSRNLISVFESQKPSFINRLNDKISSLFIDNSVYQFYSREFSKYDLVITSGNCMKMNIFGAWKAAYDNKIPLIHITRDPDLLYPIKQYPCKIGLIDKLYRLFTKRFVKYVSYTVSPTKGIIDKHFELGLNFKNIKVIPNTVDDKICQKTSYDDKDNIIIYVGSIHTNKGCHTLLRAFMKLKNRFPNYKLVFIGKKANVDIPRDDQIQYLGKMDLKNVYEYMAKSKIVVLPSEWDEAFGRVIVEAVFNGTISIGSDSGGIPEIFGYNQEYYFHKGNTDELTAILEKYMLMDRSQYEEHLEVLEKIFEQYRLKSHLKQWNELIGHVLNTGNTIRR